MTFCAPQHEHRVQTAYGVSCGDQASGTESSTDRSACAAPSRAALSNGTTILALSLSANLASVSSCRIAISDGSGLASRIAS